MIKTPRWLAAIMLAPLLFASACGGGYSSGGNEVTIVGQEFTEADVMTQLYKGLLEDAGFKTKVKNLGARDIYLEPLKKGEVQVSADYLASLTEALNKDANGENAQPVASPDAAATLSELNKLGADVGLTALEPAKAVDANAYAVTKEFAAKHKLVTLSDLGKLGMPVSLAANSDCKERRDCAKGLTEVYPGRARPGDVEGRPAPAERREPDPGAQQQMAQGQPQGQEGPEQAQRCADHRGPHRDDRQGAIRAEQDLRGRGRLPQGQGPRLSRG